MANVSKATVLLYLPLYQSRVSAVTVQHVVYRSGGTCDGSLNVSPYLYVTDCSACVRPLDYSQTWMSIVVAQYRGAICGPPSYGLLLNTLGTA